MILLRFTGEKDAWGHKYAEFQCPVCGGVTVHAKHHGQKSKKCRKCLDANQGYNGRTVIAQKQRDPELGAVFMELAMLLAEVFAALNCATSLNQWTECAYKAVDFIHNYAPRREHAVIKQG